MARIVFLHGLESNVDADLVPTGSKARHLRGRYGAETVALDTGVARELKAQLGDAHFHHPFEGYDEAFALPMQRAREALREDTELVIGSSFGGAVLLRLLHETPGWQGPSIFLAGAGVKLTPHRSLPDGIPVELIHGQRDTVVPLADSDLLASTSDVARLTVIDDEHRLSTVVDGVLDAAIERLVGGD
jgi:pimeloyl-ACP methyl ester carboxylesterase